MRDPFERVQYVVTKLRSRCAAIYEVTCPEDFRVSSSSTTIKCVLCARDYPAASPFTFFYVTQSVVRRNFELRSQGGAETGGNPFLLSPGYTREIYVLKFDHGRASVSGLWDGI